MSQISLITVSWCVISHVYEGYFPESWCITVTSICQGIADQHITEHCCSPSPESKAAPHQRTGPCIREALLCWEAEHMLLWAHGEPKCQAALKEGDSQCKSNIYILSQILSQIVNGLLAAQVNMEVCKSRERITILHCRTINKSRQDRKWCTSEQLLSLQVPVTGGSLCSLRRVQRHCCSWCCYAKGWRNRGQQRQGGSLKGCEGRPHSLSEKYVSIKQTNSVLKSSALICSAWILQKSQWSCCFLFLKENLNLT